MDKSLMKNSAAMPRKKQEMLTKEILGHAEKKHRTDRTPYFSMSYVNERKITISSECTHRDVQLAALRNNVIPERYIRNQSTLSTSEQIGLLESHVAIIGLGGLGGTVTEILARIGIGTLTLVDGDIFEDSNLNRQILSSTHNLGKKKAEVAAARVTEVNPAVEVLMVDEFFTENNGEEVLQQVDLAADCLDTITDRFILEKVCRSRSLPLVSAAIGGATGQITVVLPEDPGLRMVYGSPGKAPKKGIETTLGTLPYAAVATAALECAEVVALVLGRPNRLRKRLLLADFSYHSLDIVEFE